MQLFIKFYTKYKDLKWGWKWPKWLGEQININCIYTEIHVQNNLMFTALDNARRIKCQFFTTCTGFELSKPLRKCNHGWINLNFIISKMQMDAGLIQRVSRNWAKLGYFGSQPISSLVFELFNLLPKGSLVPVQTANCV